MNILIALTLFIIYNKSRTEFGALAQRIESQTSNLSVEGSSPPCLTKQNKTPFWCLALFICQSEGLEPERNGTQGNVYLCFIAHLREIFFYFFFMLNGIDSKWNV